MNDNKIGGKNLHDYDDDFVNGVTSPKHRDYLQPSVSEKIERQDKVMLAKQFKLDVDRIIKGEEKKK